MATTITIDRQFVKTGETAELKFTFTNPNYSLSLASLTVRTEASTDTTVAGGTVHSLVNRGVINGQRVYTATFTPTANLNYSFYRIAYDVAGDADDAFSDYFAVDTVRPTIENTSIPKTHLPPGEKTPHHHHLQRTSDLFQLHTCRPAGGRRQGHFEQPAPRPLRHRGLRHLAGRPAGPDHPARVGPRWQPDTDQPRRHHR